MAYTRTTWANGSGGGTPISAANLNNIEVELVALNTAVFYDPVTSLPGSPADKQRALLVDSLTAPTYAWWFQYESGISDANKWMFVGGSGKLVRIETSETTASTTYADLATAGPSFTVPRAGVYEIAFGAEFTNATISALNYVSHTNGGTAATDAAGMEYINQSAGNFGGGLETRKQITVAAASDVVKMQYRVSSSTGTFKKRWLSITPVRVA